MKGKAFKILIIRLSSIGDVVLTSPIVRSIRKCQPEAEVHFLTKAAYSGLLHSNPNIHKVHQFKGSLKETLANLEVENFDFILDLHQNLRSAWIKLQLGIPAATYTKDRWPILSHTKLKWPPLPNSHTVERYARTLSALDCQLDNEGLELFLPEDAWKMAREIHHRNFNHPPVAVVLGGKFATKKWPLQHFIALLNQLNEPVLLLGGPDEKEEAQHISQHLNVHHLNTAGQYKLPLSSALLRDCKYTITHDTGLMHIATALGQTIYSLWGSTVPELGFSPYKAKGLALQVKNLACRPCSKLGHAACPKEHFRCMMDLQPSEVYAQIKAHQKAAQHS